MSAEEALGIAREAEPEASASASAKDQASGLESGATVAVQSDDANDPIRGTLVCADADEIVIRSENERVGAVQVHFPRFGYSIVAAEAVR